MTRRATIRRLPLRGSVVLLLGLGLLGSPPALLRPPPAAAAGTPAVVGGFVGAYPVVASAMRAAGAPYAGWVDAGRRFLAFDPRGDGLAVEVLGDLATADRIVVLVPGVDTTLRDFDRGLGGVARRAPATQARHLYDQLRADDPRARVAVLAWLGYDPPDGLGWAAVRESSARSGAARLTSLTESLAAHRPAATITLIGHSYGAVVVGLAAPGLPAQVTDLVTVGGIGMGADRVGDLHSTARVWAAEAPADWIRRIPQVRLLGLGHGTRPADPAFGALTLPTDGVTGHDGYLVPGTGALSAIARVALGRGAEVSR
ncbi:alpha/beta hydrolase [Micromonospora sp. NBC_01796]|uniref:alpha/beta hydrolase n=1 Tax=Micromonospora sp. NBC_01796 TaxID=2975987 RepID=UPI002DDC2B39|nr:alpha/beta hydrolase [Micromonospora sp. NBC_01796]WSA83680.1 alpha/beta hydrolase family protein [Micromonospora sp. NBC_01796]